MPAFLHVDVCRNNVLHHFLHLMSQVDWVLPADVLIPEGAKPIVGWWDERIVRDEGGEKGGWNDEVCVSV
jgi:hypothetical protein